MVNIVLPALSPLTSDDLRYDVRKILSLVLDRK